MKNRITFLIALSLLILTGLGCRNLFDKPREDYDNPNISVNNQTNNSNSDTVNQSAGDNSSNDFTTIESNNGTKTQRVISGGVLNGKATNLVKPPYPPAAKAVRASGAVNVQVTVDEQGNVISAAAVSGHPLLRASAVSAARQSKFSPTLLSGKPVKVTGVIVYNFVPEQ